MDIQDAEILQLADGLEQEAEDLLGRGGLLSRIQGHAPCHVSGSVALGLMVRRDVDVWAQLSADQDVATFFQVGASIANEYEVLKASFSNHYLRGLPEFDHGLYWGIEIVYRGQRWKLDLWGYGPERFQEHTDQFAELQRSLEAIARDDILRVKTALLAGAHYRNGITGLDIYRAVLAGARSASQVIEYAKKAD